MNAIRFIICSIIAIFSIPLVHAGPTYEREFNELRERHDKAIAKAIEPENRSFRTSLQQLLERATNNKDLETAAKIVESLKALGTDTNHAKFFGTRWQAPDGVIATLGSSGHFTEIGQSINMNGTWKALSDTEVEVKRSDKTTWHFVRSDDGLSMVRREHPATWKLVK